MPMIPGDPGATLGLASEIYAAINTQLGGVSDTPGYPVDTNRRKLSFAIASAVIAHITTNASVTSTVAVTSVGGVTTGTASSGPGAGTATGVVT